jgi:uncharacterized membrane protein YgcG
LKEAMAMRPSGYLLKRAGREFARNLIWMLVVFGSLGAILVFATHLPLLGMAAFVGISVSVMAAIVTVVALWSGARNETLLSGHNDPGVPPDGGGLEGWHGGGGDGGGGGGDGGGGGG